MSKIFDSVSVIVFTAGFGFSKPIMICALPSFFAFKYSPRKGTAAARFKTQVPVEVQNKRLQALNELQDSITLKLNQREIGMEHEVLFLYESKKDPGVYYGRNEKFQLVRVKAGRDIVGLTLPVHIMTANKTALEGQLVH